MCPLVRTPNSCCINKAIHHLSFDPSLQDSAWHRAQARPKPYQTGADRDKCSRKTDKGEVVCDAGVLDVLDTLGVSLDPTSRTVTSKYKPPSAPSKRDSNPSLDHLAHKSLYIPGKQSKSPTSCSDYLKRNPGANRVRMLAEIAACLQYLHSHKIIHGSIRPDALFVDDEGYPLLSYSPENSTASINTGSHADPYSAPELQEVPGSTRSRPSIQSDIYSFGSIVHWMCTGKHPYHTEPAKLPPSMLRDPSISSPTPLRSLALNIPPSAHSLQQQQNSKQILLELTDYTLKNLVSQCRSTSPSTRPMMLSIVLQLQQILVRHVMPTLPLPPPPLNAAGIKMTSSLSAYLPRARISPTSATTASANNNLHSTSSASNMNRALVLSPRPSPPTHTRESSPQSQSRHSQEFNGYRGVGDYRSEQQQQLPASTRSTQPYSDPIFREFERRQQQYDGGNRPQDWSQSHLFHHQQQQQQQQQQQPVYRGNGRDSLDPFLDFTTSYGSVPPTPRSGTSSRHSGGGGYDANYDVAPKLAFYPPQSPVAPTHNTTQAQQQQRWDGSFLPPLYPVTAGLQPPSAWGPDGSQGGASVHRNRTL